MEKETETAESAYSCPGNTRSEESDPGNIALDACPHCGLRFADPRELLVHVFHCHPT